MSRIQKFRVLPYLPETIKPLMKIASNMWWVWNFEAIELFRRLDVELWREVGHNPIALLGSVSQKTMNRAAESESFIAHLNRVEKELGLSYPTLRARLTDVIQAMGYPVGPEPTLISDEERHRVLDDLASGKISSEEAMKLLEGEVLGE